MEETCIYFNGSKKLFSYSGLEQIVPLELVSGIRQLSAMPLKIAKDLDVVLGLVSGIGLQQPLVWRKLCVCLVTLLNHKLQ